MLAVASAVDADERLIERVKNADILFAPIDGYKMAPSRVRSYNFAREMKRRGVRAEVVSFVDDFTAPEGVPYLTRNDWPAMNRYTLRKVLSMYEVLAQNTHAPIVAQKADLNLYSMAMAAGVNGNKLILDYDDNDVEVFLLHNRLANMVEDFHPRRLLGHFASQAACCIASSNALHEMLHAYNPATHLVYTVVDTEIFDYSLRGRIKPPAAVDPGLVNLIWPGSVWNTEMAQDVLLIAEAFFAMPSAVREKAKLHLYGFGGQWDTAADVIRKTAEEKGMAANICLNSAVPPDAMPGILACMDIGLICLKHNTYTRAKSPTKMFEYMAMGLAVCTSSTGEPGRIIEDGVTGSTAASLSEYGDKLAQLIVDAEYRNRVAGNARALVNEKYSMHAAGNQLMNIFSPMLTS